MKKILLSIILILVSVIVFAQMREQFTRMPVKKYNQNSEYKCIAWVSTIERQGPPTPVDSVIHCNVKGIIPNHREVDILVVNSNLIFTDSKNKSVIKGVYKYRTLQ